MSNSGASVTVEDINDSVIKVAATGQEVLDKITTTLPVINQYIDTANGIMQGLSPIGILFPETASELAIVNVGLAKIKSAIASNIPQPVGSNEDVQKAIDRISGLSDSDVLASLFSNWTSQ